MCNSLYYNNKKNIELFIFKLKLAAKIGYLLHDLSGLRLSGTFAP